MVLTTVPSWLVDGWSVFGAAGAVVVLALLLAGSVLTVRMRCRGCRRYWDWAGLGQVVAGVGFWLAEFEGTALSGSGRLGWTLMILGVVGFGFGYVAEGVSWSLRPARAGAAADSAAGGQQHG